MEGNKLELTNKPSSTPPGTYRPLPETDMEEETATRPKSLLVKAKSGQEKDGADEKMLPVDGKVVDTSNADVVEVKMLTNDRQNGDAKLDIGELKSEFVGLTKEELMKYANDPFWVRLRWFLFISFWLLWAAMLFGAIAIIYMAPKCNPPPERTWWQRGPLAEVKSLAIDQLQTLKKEGVQGFIIDYPLDSYLEINDTDDFVQLLKAAKKAEIDVVVGLEAGITNVWFEKSESKDGIYGDYYIWKAPLTVNTSGIPLPPNNWLNIRNQSSWTYSQQRKEFYYSPNTVPHLNLRNPNVIREFGERLKKFLGFGATGIRLKNVANLVVDEKFENEPVKTNAPGFVHSDYGFYTHSKTINLPELVPLLAQWKTSIRQTLDSAPLFAAEDLANIDNYRDENGTLILDLPLQSHMFTKKDVDPEDLVKALNYTFKINNISWPLWNYPSNDLYDIVVFLLPGVPLVEVDSKLNKELLKVRNTQSIMRGSFSYHSIANRTVFAYNRVAAGNPGYLVALNPTDRRLTIDFPSEIPAISEEVTIQLFSTNYNETGFDLNVKQDSRNIPLSPKSAIVLSYVPKKSLKNE